VIKSFIETTYKVIEQNDYFHSLGHMDYVLRYLDLKTFKSYKSEVYDILKLLIRKDKLLEVNTAGYSHGLNRQHPENWVLEAFLEMGGKISIGSDAHTPEMIGYKIADVLKFLKVMGYNEVCYAEGGIVKCIPT
jgi:histidinol-phosphatase (PHP family)